MKSIFKEKFQIFEWKKIHWLIFAFFLITYGYFFQSGSWNENARIDQVRSILEHGELFIDRYSENTGDTITFNRKTYPAKAPGTTYLAIPGWILTRTIASFFEMPSGVKLQFCSYVTIWSVLGVLSALMMVFFFEVARKFMKDDLGALMITIALGLGTIAFPFSTAYFSHQISAALLFFTFAIFFLKKDEWRNWKKDELPVFPLWIAGFSAGFCLTTEYTTLIAVVPLMAYAWICLPNPKLKWITPFALGIFVGGMFLVVYNVLAYQKIYFIPHQVLAENEASQFPDHKLGFLGIQLPNLMVLLKITFLPRRGLFFFNPWLVIPTLIILASFIFPPWFRKFWKSNLCWENTIGLVVIVAFFFVNAGYGTSITYWGGGASLGPRHVIPTLPFFALFLAQVFHLRFLRWVFYPLALISIANMLVGTALEVRTPTFWENPFLEFYWPKYLVFEFSPIFHGIFSSTKLGLDSIAFNLGELLYLRPQYQLLPLFLLWIWLGKKCLHSLQSEPSLSKIVLRVWTAFLLLLWLAPWINMARMGNFYPRGEGIRVAYLKNYDWDEKCSPTYTTKKPNSNEVMLKKTELEIAHKPFPYQNPFSALWYGGLKVPESGLYLFEVEKSGYVCLYINKQLVINDWMDGDSTYKNHGEIYLEKGSHTLALQFHNQIREPHLRFRWKPPGQFGYFSPKFNLTPHATNPEFFEEF